MKKYIHNIYNKVGIKSDRTKNITKHVLLSFIYKGGSVFASFLLVPITINYLNTENYGVWLTLSSFIAWFSFFDIGLDHGLRNKFAEAKARGDLKLARGYVSTAYFTIGSVCLVLMMIFFLINFFIDWTRVFNTNISLKDDLNILMPIVFVFFCLQLVTKLITTIYIADQKHSTQGKIGFIIQVGSLILIWLITFFGKSSLLVFGVIFSSLPVLILIIFNLYAFNNTYKEYKPTFSLWKKKYLNDIFGLGLKFFIIQISGIFIFSTDNIIISHLFDPASVVPYNITFKYFSIANMIFLMILTPYWSSITAAYTSGDFDWIKKSMNNLMRFSFFSSLLIVFMIFISDFFYNFWIGNKISIPMNLTIYMALYFILVNLYLPYTYFINGIGKIKLQLISVTIMAMINIPLAIFLSKYLNLGTSGVIISTIICLIPHAILTPIQYYKLINKNAFGIWSK